DRAADGVTGGPAVECVMACVCRRGVRHPTCAVAPGRDPPAIPHRRDGIGAAGWLPSLMGNGGRADVVASAGHPSRGDSVPGCAFDSDDSRPPYPSVSRAIDPTQLAARLSHWLPCGGTDGTPHRDPVLSTPADWDRTLVVF